MATFFPALTDQHIEFIDQQHCFFVATAGEDTTVNLSPKGLDALRIISATELHWLNLTGSGNETAAHLLENPRMTVMLCSFDRSPLILRIYGRARAVHTHDAEWDKLLHQFPDFPGARQIFVLTIEQVQTSCGFAVPYYQYQGDREVLAKGLAKKSPEDIAQYWHDRNQLSIDGKPTGVVNDEAS